MKGTIKKIKSNHKEEYINLQKETYSATISEKIKEAENSIQVLQEAVKSAHKEIDLNIDNLLKQIEALENIKSQEYTQLQDAKKKLEQALSLKQFFGACEITSELLGFFGPMGAVANSITKIGTGIGRNFIDEPTISCGISNIPDCVMQMENVYKSYKQQKSQMNSTNEQMKQKREEFYKHFKEVFEEDCSTNEELLKKYPALEDLTDSDLGLNLIERELELKKEIEDLNKQKNQTLNSMLVNEQKHQQKEKRKEKLNKVLERAKAIGSTTMKVYAIYQNDQKKINNINDAINANKEQLTQLHAHKERVTTELRSFLSSMEQAITEDLSLKDVSSGVLDLKKWNLTKTLISMKEYTQNFTKDFPANHSFINTFDKMQRALDIVISLYDRIQNFQDQAKLASYIASLQRTSHISIKDEYLRNETIKLEKNITQNILMEKYKKVISAVKQWVFPFAQYFIGEAENLKVFDNTMSVDDIAESMINTLGSLSEKIGQYKASISTVDQYLMIEHFMTSQSTQFFTWIQLAYKQEIDNLLDGKESVLRSNLGISSKDALKFSNIGLELTHSEKQQDLNEVLKQYKFELKHWGNSFYKYNSKTYTIKTDPLVITCSFANDEGKPFVMNMAYKKLTDSKTPLLSPYADWSICILPRIHEAKFPSLGEELTKRNISKENIEIHLIGTGYYLMEKCNLKINEYY